ncbi:hypothetical protein P4O66_000252 [Electrophorus voltai]|uniref:Uncharacterized protein n=1 Tax=Electrophorus voltai TaxID=2609070 RepID=A0AAD8ZIS2_9TELE|nr:hypothetical protein P4O66_000252 [Electrophorus voltai]
MNPLPGTEVDHYAPEHVEQGGYESDSWAPPLPVQTYLHQGMEDELEEEERVPTPPLRGVASSPAALPYGRGSSASLGSSHHDGMQCMLQAHLDELTRAYQYEVAKQTWHLKGGSQPPKAPAPPVGYVSSTLGSDILTEGEDEQGGSEAYELSRPLCGLDYSPGLSLGSRDAVSGTPPDWLLTLPSCVRSGSAMATLSLARSSKAFTVCVCPCGLSRRSSAGLLALLAAGQPWGRGRGPQSLGPPRALQPTHKQRAEVLAASYAHTPAPEPLCSVGARLHTSWGSVGSEGPDECMVSTLERQHMAPWSSRGTLGRGSQQRPCAEQTDSAALGSACREASYAHLSKNPSSLSQTLITASITVTE